MPNTFHEPAVLLLESCSVSNKTFILCACMCVYIYINIYKICTCLAKQLNFDQLQVNAYLALHVKINPIATHVPKCFLI